ncbi:MAG: ABC transporter permease [Gemmatimonadaceae bacterium]
MTAQPTQPSRWRRLLHLRRSVRAGVQEELAFHVAMKTEELIASGLDPAAAREQALESFGTVADVRDACIEIDERVLRRERRGDYMTSFVQDVRYALRNMRRTPAFTVVVALTLALGIGANTAMFSVVDAVLLKPLPYAQPERLVSLVTVSRDVNEFPSSFAEFQHWRQHADGPFSALAALFRNGATLAGDDGEPMALAGARMSAVLPRMLGVQPLVGRAFTAEDDPHTAERTVMISERLWRLRYSASPSIVGRTITLNGNPWRVIGVYPSNARSTLPFGSVETTPTDLWMPLRLDPAAEWLYGLQFMSVVGQLRPGITATEAGAWMARQPPLPGLQIAGAPPQRPNSVRVYQLSDRLLDNVQRYLAILLGAVGFVLLIACVNVANLLLARAALRQRELAVRTALGASRSRIVTQLLVESVMRALLGGALGVAIAYASLAAFRAYLPARLPRFDEVQLDGRVLLFVIVVSLLTAIVFGLVPALRASRPDMVSTLREGGRGLAGSMRHDRLRRSLVVAEVALSFVLLVGAGLLFRSLNAILAVPRGFESANTLTASVTLPAARYPDSTRQVTFFESAIERLSALPGVKSVTVTTSLPIEGGVNGGVNIPGSTFGPDERPIAEKRVVSPNYFEALGARMVAGRAFQPTDRAGAELVVIVNESFVRRYLPDVDPIGRMVDFLWGTPEGVPQRIVGVVADIREQNLNEPSAPAIYIPATQRPIDGGYLMVRTSGDPISVLPAVRREILAIDRYLPLSQVRTLDDVVDGGLSRQRFSASLLGAFSLLALFLAAIGIYGLISYAVAQRTSEFGIRAALGAQSGDIVRLVLTESGTLVLAGVVLGGAAAAGLTRVLSSQLYAVSATDAVSFVLAAGVLVAAAMLASALPSWRASRLDPARALRSD